MKQHVKVNEQNQILVENYNKLYKDYNDVCGKLEEMAQKYSKTLNEHIETSRKCASLYNQLEDAEEIIMLHKALHKKQQGIVFSDTTDRCAAADQVPRGQTVDPDIREESGLLENQSVLGKRLRAESEPCSPSKRHCKRK